MCNFQFNGVKPDRLGGRESLDGSVDDRPRLLIAAYLQPDTKGQSPKFLAPTLLEMQGAETPGWLVVAEFILEPNRGCYAGSLGEVLPQGGQFAPGCLYVLLQREDAHPLQAELLLLWGFETGECLLDEGEGGGVVGLAEEAVDGGLPEAGVVLEDLQCEFEGGLQLVGLLPLSAPVLELEHFAHEFLAAGG